MSFEIRISGRPITLDHMKRNGVYQPWNVKYPGDKTRFNGYIFFDTRDKRSPKGTRLQQSPAPFHNRDPPKK